jgi:hypothetical protein
MQDVLCLSEEFGEEFVIPTDEVEFVRAKRPSIHPLAGDLSPFVTTLRNQFNRLSTPRCKRDAFADAFRRKAVLSKGEAVSVVVLTITFSAFGEFGSPSDNGRVRLAMPHLQSDYLDRN